MFKKLFLACLALVLVSGCSNGKKETSYTQETLPECVVAQEELTVDNWENYFELKTYDGPDFDSFGEPRDDSRRICYYLKLKDDKMYIVTQDSVLQFEFDTKSTSGMVDQDGNFVYEPTIREEHESLDAHLAYPLSSIYTMITGVYEEEEFETYNDNGNLVMAHYIDEFEVSTMTASKAKGTVYTLEIPEDKWYTDEEGNRYISVYLEDYNYTYYLYDNGIVIGFNGDEEEYNNTKNYNELFENLAEYTPYDTPSNNELLSHFWAFDSLLND